MKTIIKTKIGAIYLYCTLLTLLMLSAYTQAHPMQQSQVEAKLIDGYWTLTLRLPNNRLTAAIKKELTDTILTDYILANIKVSSVNNEQLVWDKQVTKIVKPDDHQYWQVDVKLQPKKGANVNSINIDYQVITEKIITHKVIFWLMPATESQQPKQVATLRGNNTSVTINWW